MIIDPLLWLPYGLDFTFCKEIKLDKSSTLKTFELLQLSFVILPSRIAQPWIRILLKRKNKFRIRILLDKSFAYKEF